jgi:ligand-binding sensor domain-containing protein
LDWDPFEGAQGKKLPSTNVSTSLAADDGALWVGFVFGGVSVIRGAQIAGFGEPDGFPPGVVHTLAQGAGGTLWAATEGGLARFAKNRWQRPGPEWNLPSAPIVGAEGIVKEASGPRHAPPCRGPFDLASE